MNLKIEKEEEQEELDKLISASKDLQKKLEEMMHSIVISCTKKEEEKEGTAA
jgi:hypothetical protein